MLLCLHLDLEGSPLLHGLLMESLQLVARVITTEHDLCHLKADALTQLNELDVLVKAVEFTGALHEFFIAVSIERGGGIMMS